MVITGILMYDGTRQCFLWELKESKMMDICWIKGSENNADAFTKNLDGRVFKKCIRHL